MAEFIVEVDGKEYAGHYRVNDDLTITVTVAGKERCARLVQMKPAAEAVLLARSMIKTKHDDIGIEPCGSAIRDPDRQRCQRQ